MIIDKRRKEAAKEFNEGKVRFLISTEAAGEGIDLQQNCHVLIHADLPWNKLETKLDNIETAFSAGMDDPEDMMQMVLGMKSSKFFRDIFAEGVNQKKENVSWLKYQVGLESAMRLLQMEYKGQVHTALSDSYNTARIHHKLFCTESLELDFEYINPSKETPKNQKEEAEYNCSLASFLSPELLSQFDYTGAAQEEEAEENSIENITEDLHLLEASPLAGLINNEEIANLCSKYNIEVQSWLKLATEVMNTQEMQVV